MAKTNGKVILHGNDRARGLVKLNGMERSVLKTAINWALYAMQRGLSWKAPVPPPPPSFAS